MRKVKIKDLFDCMEQLNDDTVVTVKWVCDDVVCKYRHLSSTMKEFFVKKAYFKRDNDGELWEDYFVIEVDEQ